jgi:hypothetical protein
MPMEDVQIREALNAHWHASAGGDANAEHETGLEEAGRIGNEKPASRQQSVDHC